MTDCGCGQGDECQADDGERTYPLIDWQWLNEQQATGARTRMPSQASLIDQLTELRRVANRLGLYDAADFLTNGVLADYAIRRQS